MGESNTPPVSPREPDVEEIDSDRDDEDPGLGTLGEEDFEVICILLCNMTTNQFCNLMTSYSN